MPETHPDIDFSNATPEANIYRRKPTKPFWKILKDACNCVTWIVYFQYALEALSQRIKFKGIHTVYGDFRISLVLILVILAAGIKNYPKISQLLVSLKEMTRKWQQQFFALNDDTDQQGATLQGQLKTIDAFVEVVGLIMKIALLIMPLVFYFLGLTDDSYEVARPETNHICSRAYGFYSVVTIVVAAVHGKVVARPKVLPLIVTLFLISAMRRRIAAKALVQHLTCVETMGSATTVCIDDTIFNQSPELIAWSSCGKMETVSDLGTLHESFYNVLMEAIMFSNNRGGDPDMVGLMTEDAMIQWVLEQGNNYASMEPESVVFFDKPFCSKTNKAGVAIKFKGGGEVHLHWKGDPKVILKDCGMVMDACTGKIVTMGKDLQENVSKSVEDMVSECSQCIAFGYREMDSADFLEGDEMEAWRIQKGPLVLLAVIGIKSSPEVIKSAIKKCQQAGVKVRMITDKQLLIAQAIATEYGFIVEGDLVVEGATLRGYNDETRIQLLPSIVVLASCSSSEKLLMLRTLRQLNEVVIVSGNVSEIPETEREFANICQGIVIVDDSFSSMVDMLQLCRFVFLNIQKSIQIQLTVYLAALTINFVAAIASHDTPLTSLQLQCVYLIMDIVGGMVLAFGPPSVMLPCINCKQPLIANLIWKNIFCQALYQATIILVLKFRGIEIIQTLLMFTTASPQDMNSLIKSIIFNAFVFCQLFNHIAVHNIQLSTAPILVIFIQILIRFTTNVKLEWQFWILCILIGSCSLPIGYLVKSIHIRKETIINIWKKWIRKPNRKQVVSKEPKLAKRVSLCVSRISLRALLQ